MVSGLGNSGAPSASNCSYTLCRAITWSPFLRFRNLTPQDTGLCVCVYIYWFICLCAYVCACDFIYVTYACMSMCMHVNMWVSLYVYIYRHTYIHTHINIYIRIYMYIYHIYYMTAFYNICVIILSATLPITRIIFESLTKCLSMYSLTRWQNCFSSQGIFKKLIMKPQWRQNF